MLHQSLQRNALPLDLQVEENITETATIVLRPSLKLKLCRFEQNDLKSAIVFIFRPFI